MNIIFLIFISLDLQIVTSQQEDCGVDLAGRSIALGFHHLAKGSIDAKLIDYPWMVSIGVFEGQSNYTHKCGGSLISKKFVLTAAHCFDENGFKKMTMIFGTDDLDNHQADDYFERDIQQIFVHNGYKFPQSYFDVAIAEAKLEIEFSYKTYPVCLPKLATSDVNSRANHGVELTGWGSMTTFGNTTSKLQATRLIVEPQNVCNNSYNLRSGHPKSIEIELVLPNLIQSNLLCAGSSFGSGSCSGDSGGPLVFNDKSSNPSRYRQIGIVQGSAGPCGNDIFPGIYARLDDYDVLNFIYKTAFGKNIDSFSSSEGSDELYDEYEDEYYDQYENEVCKTISGSHENQECQFPFTFRGVVYETCITGSKRQQPWCATELDNSRKYITGKWGYCDTSKCPLEPSTTASPSNAQEICMNVPKVTKTILDCRLLANQEAVSNSLEKMKNCLQEQFLLHVANKGSTSGTFCVGAVNVINRIQTCKTSSNSIDEFKDCLFKRISELISTTDTTTTTTISPPVNCQWSRWVKTGECSKTCGRGVQIFERTILVQSQNGGQSCTGSHTNREDCNTQKCVCPGNRNTNNILWIDGSSVNLGCIGFMKYKTNCLNREAACAQENSNAHLVEIFNQEQQDFKKLKANEVRKSLGKNYLYWWIGAKMKNGAMHWTHSNIKVSFWPPGMKNQMNGDGSNECGYARGRDSEFNWSGNDKSKNYHPICQINLRPWG